MSLFSSSFLEIARVAGCHGDCSQAGAHAVLGRARDRTWEGKAELPARPWGVLAIAVELAQVCLKQARSRQKIRLQHGK